MIQKAGEIITDFIDIKDDIEGGDVIETEIETELNLKFLKRSKRVKSTKKKKE